MTHQLNFRLTSLVISLFQSLHSLVKELRKYDVSSFMCKNISSKINCESAIGQLLITNPECAKTYTDDNFRIIGQARPSFHLGVLEAVYIKAQNPVLCRQKEFVFSLKLFN